MPGPGDVTPPSFPSYADLAQSTAWTGDGNVGALVATAPASAVEHADTRYADAAVLGIGGMGKVLLARDARIGRDVAIKLMHADLALDAEARERFLREAQVQGQLEHPSIVPVYDIDTRPDGSTFFTMRRVLGRTLHQILDDMRAGTSQHTQRELLQAFATVCLTIDYAHTRGVVHRDLKPANIMLGDFGEVYVLDWGIARISAPASAGMVGSPPSKPGTLLGTPLYMAPEQLADPEVGPAADIYSLGTILFEILTLERARDPHALQIPVDARPSVRAPGRDIAPELETICVRATKLLPEDRFPSARALHAAVASYLEGGRELAQRRAFAITHAQSAREALANAETEGHDYEVERGVAMRELVRALALEPTNREHVAMLAEVMEKAPSTVPAPVADQLAAQEQDVVRAGARYGVLAMLSWYLFVPLLVIAGIRRVDYLAFIAVANALTATIAWVVSRRTTIGRPIQYLLMTAMMISMTALTRILGPMILMPTMVVGAAIVLQAHPDRALRRFGLVLAVIALVAPIGLELAGILPSSYAFEGGVIKVLPQMTGLPKMIVLAFVTLANLSLAVMPAAFVASLRQQLARAQAHQVVQTWHFRRLGDDLIRAATPTPP